jgi:thymidylate kinase
LAQAAEEPDRYRVVNADREMEAVQEDVWRVVAGCEDVKT